ncbi:MAG: type II/IV secretion system protein [Candidatus Niyogibacteria bacterium]|nr:MAG: type II/IV secretion system protein [Candidatus Niyogibacteria bacterium]
MAKNNDIETKLEEFRQREAEDLARLLSEKHGLPYSDLSRMTINLDALKIVPENEAREAKMAVFQKVAKRLQVAALNPDLIKTKDILKRLADEGYTVELFFVSEASLRRAWSRYAEIPAFEEIETGLIDISPQRLEEFQKEVKNIQSLQKLIEPHLTAQKIRKISETVEVILAGAMALDASDIHLEPREKEARIRFRLDGVLNDISSFGIASYGPIISRLKLLSEMKLNIHDRAQDGRFTIRTKNADIEVRSSILPGPYGETAVMRILNPKTISITLEDLGMHPEFLKVMEEELKRPNGMILTTGPTGSGKTTTLYAFIKNTVRPGINIVTIEDPIEYHITGINQTQVDAKKGYDFANGLRSILRQDPDVILVGEIRDLETAQIAMHASLTGHLVFSTLHTNNAAGTIPRLIDLKADPTIIAPAINVTMAQRLTRKLCPECRKKDKPTAEEEKIIKKSLQETPAKYKKTAPKNLVLWRAVGCEKCNNIGYKGRIGIFEAFLVDDEVEKMILKKPAEADLKAAMKKQDMMTMFNDGVLKVLSGATSLEELKRVASE